MNTSIYPSSTSLMALTNNHNESATPVIMALTNNHNESALKAK